MNKNMNTQTIEKNWVELKGRIHSKWAKFTDAEIDGVKGDLGLIAAKVQSVYGIAKEQADRQFEDFCNSVKALTGFEAAVASPAADAAATPKQK
jgi:uncharacterized protein YjbJ (UPF0337 family)